MKKTIHKKEQTGQTIRIRATVYAALNEFCFRENMFMGGVASDAIMEYLKRRNKMAEGWQKKSA